MSMQNILKVGITLLVLFFCGPHSQAQDMHFTNYQITPTYFNPALVGNFSGTVRAGLLFRDQHELSSNVASSPYRTFSLGVDLPVIFGFKKNHWVGAGLLIMRDNVGLGSNNEIGTGNPLSQSWSRFVPGIAYHIGMDKKMKNVFSVGVQYGATSIGLSGTDFYTENRYTGNADADQTTYSNAGNDGLNGSYGSINIGITYKSQVSKTTSYIIGAGVMHLQNPEVNLFGRNGTINRRINAHGLLRREVNKQFTIEPALYLSIAGPQSNIQGQFRTEYLLKKKGDTALISGLGYRLGDAAQLLTGARYKDWLITLSFDYHLSDVSEISPYTFELGAAKVFTVNKRPDPKPIL